ncbi:MAG: SixA phosphatase family protein [Planctomycetota bacterium]|jgi:phosphohistidine phosphatase
MILYVIRHAWAGHYGDPEWPDDFQRPLTPDGRDRFAKMVRALAGRGFAPEQIATSPLARCRQTAEVVAEGVEGRPQVIERDELEPGSDLEGMLTWTNREAGDCEQVAWVGHAPDVGRLTAALIGDSRGWVRFAKGAVAAVQFHEEPAAGAGEMRWLVTAKILGC